MGLGKDLREGIAEAVAGVPIRDLGAMVDRLIDRYRTETAADAPILASAEDAAAYAAYRMPATYGAVRSALGQLVSVVPSLAPRTLLDLGGGTGAASWASVDAFASLASVTVLDQVAAALDLGRRIAAGASSPVLREASWRQATVDSRGPAADLVTVSYVLSELSAPDQDRLVRRAASAAASLVVLVEPGTPTGYARIMRARSTLLSLGFTVLAPCPHRGDCPLLGRDWCHFAARVNRSALHRKLKSGELSYEDEKFSFVAAARSALAAAPGRVIRRPGQRKGLVTLSVCGPGGVATELVAKRHGELYRAARDAEWGDPWPPAPRSAAAGLEASQGVPGRAEQEGDLDQQDRHGVPPVAG